jgi:hypothetical protein
MSQPRIFLVAALVALLAGVGPSWVSAATGIEKDEKGVKKFAVSDPDEFNRKRGYCVCHANDYLGVVTFERVEGGAHIQVSCRTWTYDTGTGKRTTSASCTSDWTPLTR